MSKILSEIQAELKAPKGQMNKFGGYRYRSCEDIVEAVKPLLAAREASLLLHDEIVEVGGRVYVKATATLILSDAGQVTATAYAREPVSKKGMDDSQITGAASSYARKYALNGLFAIDDTKDADTMDNRGHVTGDDVDLEKIKKAVKFFKEKIDEDMPEQSHDFVKGAWARLSQDEQMKVHEALGSEKAPGSNRMYKTLLKDYLSYTEDAA